MSEKMSDEFFVEKKLEILNLGPSHTECDTEIGRLTARVKRLEEALFQVNSYLQHQDWTQGNFNRVKNLIKEVLQEVD